MDCSSRQLSAEVCAFIMKLSCGNETSIHDYFHASISTMIIQCQRLIFLILSSLIPRECCSVVGTLFLPGLNLLKIKNFRYLLANRGALSSFDNSLLEFKFSLAASIWCNLLLACLWTSVTKVYLLLLFFFFSFSSLHQPSPPTTTTNHHHHQ